MKIKIRNDKWMDRLAGQCIGWKILRDMALLMALLMVLVTGLSSGGNLLARCPQLLAPVAAAMLMLVLCRHVQCGESVGLRSCALLILMMLTMQLRRMGADENPMGLGLKIMICTAGGIALGVGLTALVKCLTSKCWIFMAGVSVLLMLMVAVADFGGMVSIFGIRINAGMLAVFAALMVQGLIYGSDCSDGVRVRESLLAFVGFALILSMLSAAAEVVVLWLTVMVMALICLRDWRWLVRSLVVQAAVAFGLLAVTVICWGVAQNGAEEIPALMQIAARIGGRFVNLASVYLDPGSMYIHGVGYQMYMIGQCLSQVEMVGCAARFVEVTMADTSGVFSTFAATYGILPAVLVLVMLLGIFSRSAEIARKAADRREGAVALAFGSFLMLSGLLTATGNVGLTPLLGFTFPILADSGTGLLLSVAMMCYLLRVRQVEAAPAEELRMRHRGSVVWGVAMAAVLLVLMRLTMYIR